ncbi:unnamed protein product [Moneuplotes crassus]|uniref:Amino acid transporter transmembrane domain-containing protein n=1 Tax=Euplotes crassus TaxID=5936 RepID=A0AAD1UHT3_EUPCR|nr:unnamed protein product [Moneuplotes crassus]
MEEALSTSSQNFGIKTPISGSRYSVAIAIIYIISITLGAGLVSLPYSILKSGIPWSIIYHIFNCACSIYSVHLYLKCAEVTGYDSIARIGCQVLGQSSLYLVNLWQFLLFGIVPLAYFIICSNILRNFISKSSWIEENAKNTIGSQWFTALLLTIFIFPWILKRNFSELKIPGILFFISLICFILLFFTIWLFDPAGLGGKNKAAEWDPFSFTFNKEFFDTLTTAYVAYGFHSGFFPVFNNLKEKNYNQGMKMITLSMTFCLFIVLSVSFAALYIFKDSIHPNIIENFESKENGESWEGYTLTALYMIFVCFHFPSIFMIGKDSLLTIVALVCLRGETQQRIEQSLSFDESKDLHKINTREVGEEKIGLLVEDQWNENESYINKSSFKTQIYNEQSLIDQCKNQHRETKSFKKERSFSTSLHDPLDICKANIETSSDRRRKMIYYSVTIFLFLLTVGLSLLIRDSEIVVQYLGIVGCSLLNYIFPGLFYFVIMRKHRVNNRLWQLTLAFALIVYGIMMIVLVVVIKLY